MHYVHIYIVIKAGSKNNYYFKGFYILCLLCVTTPYRFLPIRTMVCLCLCVVLQILLYVDKRNDYLRQNFGRGRLYRNWNGIRWPYVSSGKLFRTSAHYALLLKAQHHINRYSKQKRVISIQKQIYRNQALLTCIDLSKTIIIFDKNLIKRHITNTYRANILNALIDVTYNIKVAHFNDDLCDLVHVTGLRATTIGAQTYIRL